MTVDQLERAWLSEVRRRDDEIESGTATSVPLDEALASVRARFGW